MTFVDEQPQRQSTPQQQRQQHQQQYQQQPQYQHQRGSTTTSPTTTPADINRTSAVLSVSSGSPRAYPVPGTYYQQHQHDSYSSSGVTYTSPSQRLLGSTDSSPRPDHGHDVDPFQKVALGAGTVGGSGSIGGNDEGGEHVVVNLGTISHSPPGLYSGTGTTRSSGYMDNSSSSHFNNSYNNNNNSNNNSNTCDVDERRCRICLEGEDDDSFKSQRRNSSDHNRNHSHYHNGDYGDSNHSSNDDHEDSENGRLISPCLCKGSSRYIHLGCLEKWRAMSPRKESFYRCDTCHYEYSFRRPWAASILGNKWFLRLTTVLLVFLIAYGFSWIGRVVDTKGLWSWKVQFRPDASFPLNTVMGLDWMDVVWGTLLMSAVGWLIMSVTFFIGMAVSLSFCCCCCNSEDEDGEENTGGGCFDQVGGCGYCGCYCGDCGGSSGGGGGEFIIIFFVLGIILVGLFLVFGGVYRLISTANKRALKTMKETILEVK
ncbi:MAG: hypothetical protein J3R72DRAFT_463976 [Linnemannia gamsii]|nr:MAG: hypothetical protein J3R72DRAFT_463976 [Linnemannia gamsii]